VLSYGYCQTFKQITLPMLLGMGVVVSYYAFLVFVLRGSPS
jgi:Na+-transporting methylmalonyl-CoA/oxaloacetate decarboxylase gamma subunit